MSFVRDELARRGVRTARELQDESRSPDGERVMAAGIVLVRQRPGTAAGIVFITIEDETGTTNLVVHPGTYERYRAAARHGVMLQITGKVDRAGSVVHVVCWRIETVDGEAAGIRKGSRDFH